MIPYIHEIVSLIYTSEVNSVNLVCEFQETGLTPLHSAAITGDLEITNILLSHDAEVCPRDNDSFTPIHRSLLPT